MLEDRVPQLFLGDALLPLLVRPQLVVPHETIGAFGPCSSPATPTQASGRTSHLVYRHPNRAPLGPFVKERGIPIDVVSSLNVARTQREARSSVGALILGLRAHTVRHDDGQSPALWGARHWPGPEGAWEYRCQLRRESPPSASRSRMRPKYWSPWMWGGCRAGQGFGPGGVVSSRGVVMLYRISTSVRHCQASRLVISPSIVISCSVARVMTNGFFRHVFTRGPILPRGGGIGRRNLVSARIRAWRCQPQEQSCWTVLA